MIDELPNVISTASLLLAVVTALMGFWYADVARAIAETEPKLAGERTTLRKKIAPIFWSKALPLALGSLVIAAIFLCRAIGITRQAADARGSGASYDDMKTALVATEAMMLLLAIVTVTLACRLGAKCLRLL